MISEGQNVLAWKIDWITKEVNIGLRALSTGSDLYKYLVVKDNGRPDLPLITSFRNAFKSVTAVDGASIDQEMDQIAVTSESGVFLSTKTGVSVDIMKKSNFYHPVLRHYLRKAESDKIMEYLDNILKQAKAAGLPPQDKTAGVHGTLILLWFFFGGVIANSVVKILGYKMSQALDFSKYGYLPGEEAAPGGAFPQPETNFDLSGGSFIGPSDTKAGYLEMNQLQLLKTLTDFCHRQDFGINIQSRDQFNKICRMILMSFS